MSERERAYFEQFYADDAPELPEPPTWAARHSWPPGKHVVLQASNGWFESHHFDEADQKWVRIAKPDDFPV